MCSIKLATPKADSIPTGVLESLNTQQIQGRFDANSAGNNRFMTGNLLKIG
jgi:hypothetical protein